MKKLLREQYYLHDSNLAKSNLEPGKKLDGFACKNTME